MNTLSSHVLDTTLGKPAADMQITLTTPSGDTVSGLTDSDGRCKSWGSIQFEKGVYTLRFDCKPYLIKHHGQSFYPHVDISFDISSDNSVEGQHYHVPLLVTPYSYSTYRGS